MVGRRIAAMPPESHALGQLEARVVLSTTYYEWVGVEMLPGYQAEYGTPDDIAGISENGRYMWSEAAADPADADEPFLILDGELRYLREIDGLSGLSVHAINSDGLVLATEPAGDRERVLTTHIEDPTTRAYLDELELSGDSGLDLASASPVALTDSGAVLVLTPVPETDFVRLWIVRDQVVSSLWEADPALAHGQYVWEHLHYGELLIDTNASDTVIGYRALSEPEIRPMLWSPQTGVLELTDLTQVASVNDDGTIMAKQDDRLVLWRDGDTEWTGARDGDHDDQFGSAWAPAGRAGDGVPLITQINRGPAGSAIHTFLSASSPFEPITLLEQEERPMAPAATLTESGLVHDGRAGWFSAIDPADAVIALGGAPVYVWGESDRVSVETWARRDRRLTISRGGLESWSLGHSGSAGAGYFAGDLMASPGNGRALAFSGPAGLQILGAGRYESLEASEITSRVTGFFRRNGFLVVAGTTEAGELRLAFDYDVTIIPKAGAFYSIGYASLSEHLARRGLMTPAFASNLDSFIAPWGAMTIAGIDDAGDLHAVWWSPGLGSPLWTSSNLSAITGAPKLVGNVTASATPWNGMQVFGTDARGHLITLWWSPASGRWQWDDLTADAGGETLVAGSIAGAATRWGAIEVIGRTAENEVATYWWAPGSGGWTYESITAQQTEPTARIVGPLSFQVASDGSQHIAGVSAEGEIIHLYWVADGQDLWRGENLTERALH